MLDGVMFERHRTFKNPLNHEGYKGHEGEQI
jgi:hypothetical protein